MRIEVPECRRCCLCLPLRRGLLAWAYSNLVFQILALLGYIHIIIFVLSLIGHLDLSFIMIMTINVIMLTANAVYCILIIVAGHKKNWKLLRVSYRCGLVIWVASAIFFLVQLYYHIKMIDLRLKLKTDSESVEDIVLERAGFLVAEVLSLCLNGYIILLVRSEMLKLQEQSLEIEFVNNAEESEVRCVRTPGSAISRANSDNE